MKQNYFASISMAALFLLIISTVQAQTTTFKPTEVLEVTHMDVSAPLRDVQNFNQKKTIVRSKEIKNKIDFRENLNEDPKWEGTDPVIQNYIASGRDVGVPEVVQVLAGSSNADNETVIGHRLAPPDTQGDVGPNHYLQMTNLLTRIYDKDGTLLLGPVPNSHFWAGFVEGGIDFGSFNHGDPIVVYDEYADRWIVSHFVTGPYYMLIAISQTPDPTGAWYRYAIPYSNFPDYPKLGVWNDGVYITTNDFNGGFVGASLVGFPKAGFYDGTGGNYFHFFMDGPSFPNYGSWLPADADGPTPPPNSTHYTFSRSYGVANTMHMLTTVPDWTNLANTTFSFSDFAVDSYYTSGNILNAQPNGQYLNSLGDRLMYRLQYRNFGSHQVLVANHSVQNTSGGPFGVRWYEMRAASGSSTFSIYQNGTFLPADGENRWMGSIAMNGNGDIALGYSLSSSTTHPSIRFTGQSAVNSGSGLMDLPETAIHVGIESQTGVARWGDYSMMSVDPADDESFWYTQMHGSSGNWGWDTKIAEIRLNGITDPTTIAVTPPSFTFTVAPDESDNDLLNIANTGASGAGNLSWSIDFAEVVAPEITSFGVSLNDDSQLLKYHEDFFDKSENLNEGNKEEDILIGSSENNQTAPIILAAGGPDSFGYEYIDSDEADGPVFNWNDITATGTSLILSDDSFQEILLPFDFSFYGIDHDRVKVSSNGYLTFGSDGTNFSNDAIPDTRNPNDIISPFWDDLFPGLNGQGTVHYMTTATQFIVQYTDVPRFITNDVSYTFQVILNSDGSILFQYSDIIGTYTETIGIEDATGTDGLQVSNNGTYVYNGLAVLISPPTAACAWLSVSPESGLLAAGENEDVIVSVDATGLVDGTYECEINISSNASNASLVTVPVTLIVQTNTPPVAVCQDVEIAADANCEAIVLAADVDDGSYDPDGDPITLSLSPAGPYALGETSVILTVTDDKGAESECPATVTVVDETVPEIIASTSPITLWPPNHKYTTINMSQILVSASDNCSDLSNADVYISKVSSDEEEDAKGGGDGKTSDDIVIASDCQSVKLRKERKGGGNGRVYTIYLEVVDEGGNTGTATAYVHIPHNNGGIAIDDGMAYEEVSDCGGNKSTFASIINNDVRLINYPNPFTGTTTISFTPSETQYSTLKVYDTFGKEVATLFDGMAESGQKYLLEFDGGNLINGIYIYHLQSGNNVSMLKKMILIK